MLQNLGIKDAMKTMELIMSNPMERNMIRARMDAEIDHRTLMLEAETRCKTAGKEDAHKQDALRMKKLGMSFDLISNITGLSFKEISEL